jgi:hypothetical protein
MRPHSLSIPPLQAADGAERLRARIRGLLREPAVARRVATGLAQAEEEPVENLPGTPPCFRAAAAGAESPVLVKRGRCRAFCRSIDCLCGRYPRSLNERDIAHGRRLEPLAS